ncbi:MAG: tRNA (adenosine(37)-N6)-threonylcarbamoyltransferase complex dimerization subunit type 1 TsaB [Bacteroides sp.]|nr:tRNA (adenosine(37)-N6)-threonylcarbamoyltransferase complex dimerization subunit type 1 TsaB [Bacteroides sp.]MCM1379180.1 tRNA (adenosine(37)-N6)-threonylcarbamoyltransferase complex dimerization subunit type 1 TsaB [Bacteroides sp.]MCM1445171.1 tRNA (adenosine(37)-N6)-threonylcarbamoyltransferase complex dimerization subunit type 1 TsaB [Prevotella sp.]
MANIVNIETSTEACSVALTGDCTLLANFEERSGRRHAELLSGFIKQAIDAAKEQERTIDAVAVSIGPGSYTGLRIGLSEAKGLAYALGVPLIGVPTLQIMATNVMFNHHGIDLSSRFAPMIDARRMEVYTCVLDMWLKELMHTQPLILEADSYGELLEQGPLLFMGNAIDKARTVINHPNSVWVEGIQPLAADMLALSEKAFRAGNFLDLAYSTPLYLKEFQATKPKNKI